MSLISLLQEIFQEGISKANVQAKGTLDKSCLYRSFVVEIPDANNFRYGFIYTENGIKEYDGYATQPTVKMIMKYSTFLDIMNHKLSVQDAVYYGFALLDGENPLLHMNILMLVFSSMV